MNKYKIRDILRLISACLFCWLYIPAGIAFCTIPADARRCAAADVGKLKSTIRLNLPFAITLLFLLHNNRYYRTVFYHRLGVARKALVGWIRPGDRYFSIDPRTKLGGGVMFHHPYATVLNATEIGENFTFIQNTTLGDSKGKTPIIGKNVWLGANVTIVGGVTVGDNVVIGAGAVVVKDIPSNSLAAGNPAQVVKTLPPPETAN